MDPQAASAADEGTLLVRLAAEVTSTLDLQEVLDKAFIALRQLVRFDGGAIQLVDDGHLMAVATDPPATAEAMTVRIPLGQGVSGRIAADGEPIYIADIATDERVHPEGRKRGLSPGGVRSYFGAPLILRGAPIGVVQIDSKQVDAFAGADRARMLAFLPTIASAVQNAQLHLREREAMHAALHDQLTGLPNRALLRQQLAEAIESPAGNAVSVVLIDIDRFSDVNDTLGIDNGDRLLIEIAARLDNALADQVLARLGGDVFAVVVPGGAEHAATVAEQVIGVLQEPFRMAGLSFELTASIGVACWPLHGDNADHLLQRAEMAQRRAKTGQYGYEIYGPDRDASRSDRLALLGGLRRAMAEDRLIVHYQPQVEFESGRPVRCEALVRWDSHDEGLLAPGRFIAAAEQTPLIRQLTTHVLERALAQCAEWASSAVPMGVSVNVSARTLNDTGFPDEVARRLDASGVDPAALTLEITESGLMLDPERARTVLQRLSELGVRIAIDDFGTGYSSLAYLSRLPVHEVKIDQSFVAAMAEDERNAAIVRSTLDMGHNLGLVVVAEGIDREEAWRVLSYLGCDLGQGFYILRPSDAEIVSAWAATAAEM